MTRRRSARVSGRAARGAALVVAGLAVMAASASGREAPARVAKVEPAPVVRDLPFRREVLLPPAAAESWVVITADSLLDRRCAAGFADVRLVDARGGVLPMLVLWPRSHDEVMVLVGTHLLRWQERDDGSPGCELDLGELAGRDFSLRFSSPASCPLDQWRCSGDRQKWEPCRIELPRQVPGRPPVDVTLPRLLNLNQRCRYLRLVRSHPPDPDRPDTLRVYRSELREAPLVPATFRSEGPKIVGGRLMQIFTFADATVTVAALRFDRPLRDIHQQLTLETYADRFGWRIQSLTPDSDPRLLRCEPTSASSLRLSAEGVDPAEPPFAVTAVLAAPQRWAFPHPGAGRCWLLYGDRWRTPRAGYAELDFALAPLRLPARLGPEERNPDFAPTGGALTWFQRHPVVLTVVMLAILGAVVALAVGARPRDGSRG